MMGEELGDVDVDVDDVKIHPSTLAVQELYQTLLGQFCASALKLVFEGNLAGSRHKQVDLGKNSLTQCFIRQTLGDEDCYAFTCFLEVYDNY